MASNFVSNNTGNANYSGQLGMRFRTSNSSVSTQTTLAYMFSGLSVRYSQINDAPILVNALLNDQEDITVNSLFSQVPLYYDVTADLFDEQGCQTIHSVSACIYRTGAIDKTCYATDTHSNLSASCLLSGCSGSEDKTASVTCTFQAINSLDPTDYGTP